MQRPAEAELLDEALKRKRPKLSARRAASAAGISEGWWRQITKGVQTRGTGSIPVVAPAETIARMALAVGVSEDELKEAGRHDAAEVLPAIREQQTAVDLTAVSNEELAAEFLRRMRGQAHALEIAAQSDAPPEGRKGKEVDLHAPQAPPATYGGFGNGPSEDTGEDGTEQAN